MENEIYNDEDETPEEVVKAIAQSLLFLQMEAKRHRMTKIATAIGKAYLVAIELDDNQRSSKRTGEPVGELRG